MLNYLTTLFCGATSKVDAAGKRLKGQNTQHLNLPIQFQFQLLAIEHMLYGLNQPTQAIEAAQQLLADDYFLTLDPLVGKAKFLIGTSYSIEYHHSESIVWLEQALDIFSGLNLGYERTETQERLGFAYTSLGLPNKKITVYFDQAKSYFRNLSLFNFTRLEEREARYQFTMGGEVSAVIKKRLAIKELYETLNLNDSLYAATTSLGLVYCSAGEYAKAAACFQSLDSLERVTVRQRTIASSLMNQTVLYRALYQFDKARQIHSIVEGLISAGAWQMFGWGLSEAYLKMGLYDEAESFFKPNATEETNPRWVTTVAHLASIAYYQRRFEKAQSYVDIFWSRYTKNKLSPRVDVDNNYNKLEVQIGDIARLLGSFKQSKIVYQDSLTRLDLFKKEKLRGYMALAIVGSKAGLADIAHKEGNIELAIQLAEEVYVYLQNDPFAYHVNLFEPYLILFRIFEHTQPEKAIDIIKTANQLVVKISEDISDLIVRAKFLNHSPNVPEVRKLFAQNAKH